MPVKVPDFFPTVHTHCNQLVNIFPHMLLCFEFPTPCQFFPVGKRGGGVGRLCIAHFCWRCKDWLKKIRQAAKPLPPHPPIHHLIHTGTSGLHPSGFVQESSPINRGISYSLYMREILPNLSHVSIGFSKSRY